MNIMSAYMPFAAAALMCASLAHARTVEDALKTRPAEDDRAFVNAVAKQAAGAWVSNGEIRGKVVFEDRFADEASVKARWDMTKGRVAVVGEERGGRCVIEKRFATANKETRIYVSSPWIINHVLFLEPRSADNPDGYAANSEYGQFMAYLTSYSQLSKNTHDDAPDMLSMLAAHEGANGDSIVASVYAGFF